MFLVKQLLVLIIGIALCGCSVMPKKTLFKNREKDYLQAQSIPPLRIPPGVSSVKMHNKYPISDHHFGGNEEVSLLPPGIDSPDL